MSNLARESANCGRQKCSRQRDMGSALELEAPQRVGVDAAGLQVHDWARAILLSRRCAIASPQRDVCGAARLEGKHFGRWAKVWAGTSQPDIFSHHLAPGGQASEVIGQHCVHVEQQVRLRSRASCGEACSNFFADLGRQRLANGSASGRGFPSTRKSWKSSLFTFLRSCMSYAHAYTMYCSWRLGARVGRLLVPNLRATFGSPESLLVGTLQGCSGEFKEKAGRILMKDWNLPIPVLIACTDLEVPLILLSTSADTIFCVFRTAPSSCQDLEL